MKTNYYLHLNNDNNLNYAYKINLYWGICGIYFTVKEALAAKKIEIL